MKHCFTIVFVTIFCASCAIIDNFDEEPMFLEISEATFNPPVGIDPAHDIRDVWVFADGFNVGIFELPARVPVLGTDSVDINLLPGIRNNGLSNSSRDFPFYKPTVVTLPFEASSVEEIELETSYLDDILFSLNEDFESSNVFTADIDNDTSTFLQVVDESTFGSKAGRIDVNTATSRFQIATSRLYPTDVLGTSEVYLEMNHRNEVGFAIGIIGHQDGFVETIGVISLFPTDEWRKLYLDLSPHINAGLYDNYQILIAGSGLVETGQIWLDNLRVVHL